MAGTTVNSDGSFLQAAALPGRWASAPQSKPLLPNRQNLLEPSPLTESHQACAIPPLSCFCIMRLLETSAFPSPIRASKEETPRLTPFEVPAHHTVQLGHTEFRIHQLPTGKEPPHLGPGHLVLQEMEGECKRLGMVKWAEDTCLWGTSPWSNC